MKTADGAFDHTLTPTSARRVVLRRFWYSFENAAAVGNRSFHPTFPGNGAFVFPPKGLEKSAWHQSSSVHLWTFVTDTTTVFLSAYVQDQRLEYTLTVPFVSGISIADKLFVVVSA